MKPNSLGVKNNPTNINTFDQKLKAGLQGEEIARIYLESLGHDVALNPGTELDSQRRGDLVVNGKWVETKLDILASRTGNICIEHQSLKTHTAPYYIWCIPTFYKTTKVKLEHLVSVFPDRVKIGDDKRDGTLVPIDSSFFKETFIRL